MSPKAPGRRQYPAARREAGASVARVEERGGNRLRVLFVEEPAANIRPELLQFVGQPVPHDEHAQCFYVAAGSAVFGSVVDIGNSGGRGVADDLRVVETGSPGIG